jgi:hypothetical protein
MHCLSCRCGCTVEYYIGMAICSFAVSFFVHSAIVISLYLAAKMDAVHENLLHLQEHYAKFDHKNRA